MKRTDDSLVDEGWTLLSAMRHHAFWALFSTFFFTAIAMYSLAAQIVAYMIDVGFQPLEAATAWGFSGVVLLFGMLGAQHLGAMSTPALLAVVVLGVGFWFGMIKRSFKIKPVV